MELHAANVISFLVGARHPDNWMTFTTVTERRDRLRTASDSQIIWMELHAANVISFLVGARHQITG
jgi:hypothetical protein